jgi:hypothetical protein
MTPRKTIPQKRRRNKDLPRKAKTKGLRDYQTSITKDA